MFRLLFFFSDDLQSMANPRKPSPSCRACAVRTHAFSMSPETPTHRVRALRYTPYSWIQRSSEKKRSRRLFHLPCDKRLPEKFPLLMFGHSFSDGLQRLNPLQPAPSPVGEGWGEGILQIAATFPKPLSLLKYKPCGLLPSL